MSNASKALGLQRGIDYLGKTRYLAEMGPGVRAEFEAAVERRAWDTLRRASASLSPEEYAADRARLRDDIAVGKYEFYGEVCQGMLGDGKDKLPSVVAILTMLQIQLRLGNPSEQHIFTNEFVHKFWEDKGREINELWEARTEPADPTTPPANQLATTT